MFTISSVAVAPVPPQAPTVIRVQPVTSGKVSEVVSPKNQGVAAPLVQAGGGVSTQQVSAPSSFPPVIPTGEAVRAHNFNNSAAPERAVAGLPDAVAFTQTLVAQAALQAAAAPGPESEPMVNSAATRAPEQLLHQDDGAARPSSFKLEQEAQSRAAQARAQEPELLERFRGELPAEVKNPAMAAMETQINELLPNMWRASRVAVDVLIGDEARAAAAARAEVLTLQRPQAGSESTSEASANYSQTAQLPQPPPSGQNLDRMA